VVDEVELELILVDARRGEAEDAHAAEQELTLPLLARLPPCFDRMFRTLATVRVGLSVAVSTSTATPWARSPRRAPAGNRSHPGRSALDRGLDPVLRHVDRARVLDYAAQVGLLFGSTARLHGDRDVLADPRELLRHPVPPGEHGVLANFEDATHCG
jgi:hypothetical protein